mmetsp:Transcript_22081/g.65413  ORF Transcript_22081/g.65413 Transcript_22081/m.65413 type:complete len:432 (-) Transcript_22081:259-1554(-)
MPERRPQYPLLRITIHPRVPHEPPPSRIGPRGMRPPHHLGHGMREERPHVDPDDAVRHVFGDDPIEFDGMTTRGAIVDRYGGREGAEDVGSGEGGRRAKERHGIVAVGVAGAAGGGAGYVQGNLREDGTERLLPQNVVMNFFGVPPDLRLHPRHQYRPLLPVERVDAPSRDAFRPVLPARIATEERRMNLPRPGIERRRSAVLAQPMPQPIQERFPMTPLPRRQHDLRSRARVPVVGQFRERQMTGVIVDRSVVPRRSRHDDPRIDRSQFGAHRRSRPEDGRVGLPVLDPLLGRGSPYDLFVRIDGTGQDHLGDGGMTHQRASRLSSSAHEGQVSPLDEGRHDSTHDGMRGVVDGVGFVHARASLEEHLAEDFGRRVEVARTQYGRDASASASAFTPSFFRCLLVAVGVLLRCRPRKHQFPLHAHRLGHLQ